MNFAIESYIKKIFDTANTFRPYPTTVLNNSLNIAVGNFMQQANTYRYSIVYDDASNNIVNTTVATSPDTSGEPLDKSYVIPQESNLKLWIDALEKGDTHEQVVCLYDTGAILLPTLQLDIIDNHRGKVEYFTNLMSKNPRVEVNTYNQLYNSDNIEVINGIYTFILAGGEKIPAYYTFAFNYTETGQWKIMMHHSTPVKSVLYNEQ